MGCHRSYLLPHQKVFILTVGRQPSSSAFFATLRRHLPPVESKLSFFLLLFSVMYFHTSTRRDGAAQGVDNATRRHRAAARCATYHIITRGAGARPLVRPPSVGSSHWTALPPPYFPSSALFFFSFLSLFLPQTFPPDGLVHLLRQS